MKSLRFLWLALIAFVLSSCGTGNRFASSFGKRRYTKGFYVDLPAGMKSHAASHSTAGNIATPPKSRAAKPFAEPKPAAIINTIPAPSVNVSNNKVLPAITHRVGKHPKAASAAAKPETLSVNKDDDTNGDGPKGSGETNYWAILGFAVCLAGVIATVIAQYFSVVAIILLIIGAGLSVYSLTLTKIYWSWLAIIGLSIAVLLVVLFLA